MSNTSQSPPLIANETIDLKAKLIITNGGAKNV